MEHKKSNQFTILDFYADWCGPCRQMKPIIEELEKEYQDRVNFEFIDANRDQAKVAQYQVLALPTYVFIKNGRVIGQIAGFQTKNSFKQRLDQLLNT